MGNPFFDVTSKMPDQTLNRPSCCIAKGTDSVAFNLFGHIKQHVNFFRIRIAAKDLSFPKSEIMFHHIIF
jgi:hypothetical protein